MRKTKAGHADVLILCCKCGLKCHWEHVVAERNRFPWQPSNTQVAGGFRRNPSHLRQGKPPSRGLYPFLDVFPGPGCPGGKGHAMALDEYPKS